VRSLVLLLFLAGCDGAMPERTESPRPRPAVQTATLTGLYESGPSRLCIVEAAGAARFGLVVRRGADSGCSGAGVAARRGDRLRLTMAGEAACAIDARLDGAALTFPARVPPGCAYYCAPDAGLAGAAFAKTGGAEADALRARDLVGDPLCG